MGPVPTTQGSDIARLTPMDCIDPPSPPRLRSRVLLFILVPLTLVAVGVGWQVLSWPRVAELTRRNPETTAFIERYRRQADRADWPAPRWHPVAYGRISDHLKHAVLVAEDIDFFSHRGFAWDEVQQAVKETATEGKRLRGASTLTQQLARNLWLGPSRNPWRKVKEALLTMHLESDLGKRRILELYLNVVELGPGIYGVEAAARHYFGKSAAELGPRESAALAAALSRPTTWHPGCGRPGYEKRIELIARRMERTEWLRKLL